MPTNPELLKMPFAQDGDKNSIPETTSPTTGLFSQQYGFQSINSLPLTAGGKAISRLDYNGAMYMLSNLLYYAQRGYTFVYDDNMPYVVGCRVLDPNDGQVYNCIAGVAAGVGAPSATPTNWELAPSADVLGFRKPSTTYAVGNIAYHPDLPTGWYLECTTAGDTDAGALVITSPSVGDTVTDGTVVWTIGKSLSVNGDTLYGTTIGRSVTDSVIRIVSGPTPGNGASLILVGKDNTSLGDTKGSFSLNATTDSDTICTLTGYASGKLLWDHNDLAGSAIVAKSLGTNGYVKYASGLIVQWGRKSITGNGSTAVTLPITFTANYSPLACLQTTLVDTNFIAVQNTNLSTITIHHKTTTTNYYVYWFAIGY